METPNTKHLVILGILIWLKQACALDCYSCKWYEDKCKDPFKTTGVSTVPCSGPCFKGQTKDSNKNLNAPAASRGCAPVLSTGDKCSEDTVDGITVTVCMCNGNLCNFALPVGSSVILMAATIVLSIAVHK